MTRRKTDTSRSAFASILPATAILERLVLATLHEYPSGLTVDETCKVAERPRYSLQPRFTALRDRGAIRDTGHRRLNASGAKAIVWRACHLDREGAA